MNLREKCEMNDVVLQSVLVTFSLPDWCSDESFDEEIPVYYSEGHVYAGQFKEHRHDNVLSSALFDQCNFAGGKVVETELIPLNPRIVVEFDKISGFSDRMSDYHGQLVEWLRDYFLALDKGKLM